MNERKIKKICFIYLQIVCFCSVLIYSIKHGKYAYKKKNSSKIIKKLILSCGKKKIHKIKNSTLSYIKNYDVRNWKEKIFLKDIFNQLSGNQPPENSNIEQYKLTPKLRKTVQLFQSFPNNPYHKSQQVILLGKKCPPMPEDLKTRQNQVLVKRNIYNEAQLFLANSAAHGCQSTVYIYPKVESLGGKKIIQWLGHSGIVYILIEGLSGYTPEEIFDVNPNFIALTGISEFLTMSRINGYLNIMNKIKAFSAKIMKDMEY
ncbi:SufE-like protein [Plasmodium ovale curtisi]|uniref:SufE-like protein n=1 Tax=Plasmodium ovale curtisi TaxID=864141 RepID=A0A1A8XC08_PLAOA|nr:SufE-like protein [Plasmodium ovale curtisi]SBT01395.1 SufE-like protein [Plasmodium ovale curtisi]